jgi:hypothetical protein
VKNYEVQLGGEDRQKVANLYKEILERQEQIGEITKRKIREAHPASAEKLKDKKFQGPITISPEFAVLRWCVGSGEDMCLCYADKIGQCWMCSSEGFY